MNSKISPDFSFSFCEILSIWILHRNQNPIKSFYWQISGPHGATGWLTYHHLNTFTRGKDVNDWKDTNICIICINVSLSTCVICIFLYNAPTYICQYIHSSLPSYPNPFYLSFSSSRLFRRSVSRLMASSLSRFSKVGRREYLWLPRLSKRTLRRARLTEEVWYSVLPLKEPLVS